MQLLSQEQLNIGINGGLAIGNAEPTISKIAFGADVNYLFDIGTDFVVGPSIGIAYFNPEENIEAPVFLPISAAIRFNSIEDRFYVGVDGGYAISISDYDNGFYIKPIVGYKINDPFSITAFYSGVRTSGPTYGYAGIGLTYDFKAAQNAQYAY